MCVTVLFVCDVYALLTTTAFAVGTVRPDRGSQESLSTASSTDSDERFQHLLGLNPNPNPALSLTLSGAFDRLSDGGSESLFNRAVNPL